LCHQQSNYCLACSQYRVNLKRHIVLSMIHISASDTLLFIILFDDQLELVFVGARPENVS
jgi:hypothetical protein